MFDRDASLNPHFAKVDGFGLLKQSLFLMDTEPMQTNEQLLPDTKPNIKVYKTTTKHERFGGCLPSVSCKKTSKHVILFTINIMELSDVLMLG